MSDTDVEVDTERLVMKTSDIKAETIKLPQFYEMVSFIIFLCKHFQYRIDIIVVFLFSFFF